jgi:hypothetical protein
VRDQEMDLDEEEWTGIDQEILDESFDVDTSR